MVPSCRSFVYLSKESEESAMKKIIGAKMARDFNGAVKGDILDKEHGHWYSRGEDFRIADYDSDLILLAGVVPPIVEIEYEGEEQKFKPDDLVMFRAGTVMAAVETNNPLYYLPYEQLSSWGLIGVSDGELQLAPPQPTLPGMWEFRPWRRGDVWWNETGQRCGCLVDSGRGPTDNGNNGSFVNGPHWVRVKEEEKPKFKPDDLLNVMGAGEKTQYMQVCTCAPCPIHGDVVVAKLADLEKAHLNIDNAKAELRKLGINC